jgi:hypothetical protein
MLKELRLETVEVTVELAMCEGEGSLLQQSGTKYYLKSSEFIHLCTRIRNLSGGMGRLLQGFCVC